jgi:diguanylate cyclase (GGDEF)-like protein/PAS domain S-box-containing protein
VETARPTRLQTELSAARDALREAQRALRREQERAQRYLDVAGTMIVALDVEHRIVAINRKGCAVLAADEETLLGCDWTEAVVAETDRAQARRHLLGLATGAAASGEPIETGVRAHSGETRVVSWYLTPLSDDDGRPVGTLVSGEDVTERRLSEQQISYLAYHDALTGLPNRTLLEEHMTLALARTRRTGAAVALLHVDLDAFKLVNDSLGHAAGDRLLNAVAARVRQATRSTDLLARPGGDELLLLIADIHDDPVTAAERAASGIVEALQEPFAVGGAEFQVGCSIGISLHPRDAGGADELLAHADSAMYRAKAVARGGWAVYAEDRRDPLERLSLSTRLRRAICEDELLLHYQPIFQLPGGELIGVEALLRWNDPERGMVPPGAFIPLAEETGLIEDVGDWVVGAVCHQQVEWAELGLTPQISFNVSPRQLRRLDFVDRVAEHLAATGADPQRLTVELTESATMEDPSTAEPILRRLHDLGLRLALDDFGSGYSSLSRLLEMPVETLKIDRAFLREVPDNREAAAIVTAILRLSQALGRTTVAEGVETEAQRRFLEDEGCQLAQGFLLGRPLPPAGVEALLSARA